jgi:5-methylcytosine-specific restriction enzyme A
VLQIDSPSGKRLAEVLSARFGLELLGKDALRDGQRVCVVRPKDLSEPNGFAIEITPRWRSIEATFVPDTFSGHVIRSMGEVASEKRASFCKTVEFYSRLGGRLAIRINGVQIHMERIGESGHESGSDLPPTPWISFELKATRLSEAPAIGGDVLVREACEAASCCLAIVLSIVPTEEEADQNAALFELGLPEGAKSRVEVNRYERSPLNRATCIAAHGSICGACGFDFGRKYGQLGEGYIEVHHLVPVSLMGGSYVIDPVRDLIPLCANCHAIVHRRNPPIPISELRQLIGSVELDRD